MAYTPTTRESAKMRKTALDKASASGPAWKSGPFKPAASMRDAGPAGAGYKGSTGGILKSLKQPNGSGNQLRERLSEERDLEGQMRGRKKPGARKGTAY